MEDGADKVKQKAGEAGGRSASEWRAGRGVHE
jgi:hypothetical protein